jgi:hypothetical protein
MSSIRVIPALAFALSAALASAPRLHAQQDVRTSHITGNMPPADSFASFITRDVNRYFQLPGRPMTLKVEYELLSPRISQTGVGLPKFAIWVRVSDDSTLLYEGAMKLAAIEQKEFEVLWFSTLAEIRAKPADLDDRYPAALIPRIIARAARAGAGPAK